MNIKPIKIALFLICTLLVLFGLTFLSKEGAIVSKNQSENGITIGNLSLKFPTSQQLLLSQKDSTATLDEIKLVTESVIPVEEEIEGVLKDTISQDSLIGIAKKVIDFTKIDTTQIERIHYPESVPNFVESLRENFQSNSCRILHYGDSQIEGDRITAYLRNRLQGLYGGNGPGFIPIKQVYSQISAEVTPSENWERYAMFDPTKEKFEHKKYGLYLSVSRFTPYESPVKKDTVSIPLDSLKALEVVTDTISVLLDSIKTHKATITIAKSNRTYRRFRKFNTIGLHYGNAAEPISIKVFNEEELIQQDSLINDGKYHQYTITVDEAPSNLRIELEGKVSADFYGLTLDSNKGIQIDNVAMRGASGTIFAKANGESFASMSKALKPKLVLMQYGGNTVPYLRDSTAVEKYGGYMMSQIRWIKRRTNNSQILFIGPSDMSTSINGKMQTYELLPYLNEVLKQRCLGSGVAYWRMYDAMGGKGSMPLWVDQMLAGSDFTHFSNKGAKIISELLFTSLYLDLKNEAKNEDD